MLQAVLQSPFNGGSPTADGQTDTRFTYFPASAAGGAGDVGTADTATVALAGQAGKMSGSFKHG